MCDSDMAHIKAAQARAQRLEQRFLGGKHAGSRLRGAHMIQNVFLLVFGDRLLFIANSSPKSKVTVMTLLLQSSVIVTVVLGKVIYKEKHFLYKLLCASVIIGGIVIGTL